MTGTVSRALFLLTCSHAIARQVRGCPGIRYRAARLRLYLQYRLFTTCSLLISYAYLTCSLPTKLRLVIKLRLAYILCYFIRKLRLACIASFYFSNEEYLIASVDFIVALRRTKGRRRRTLRSPSPPSSGLHLLTPGCPLRRGISAAAGLYQFRQLVSGAGRSSPVPNFIWLSVFGLRSFAFQSGCWAGIACFSLLGGWAVRACGYLWFCYGLS